MYYITGWLLRASLKIAKQWARLVRGQLDWLVSKATYSREIALEDENLPTAKVEVVERFGGLYYATEDFFSFVERLKYVFIHTLTPELLLMNVSCLIELVYKALNADDGVLSIIATFCKCNISIDTIEAVATYITCTYCCMRGKDFARNLMSRDTCSLK